MQDSDALFEALRHSATAEAAHSVEHLVREGSDQDLARINPIALAAASGVREDSVIAALLHGARLGLFEMSWNILCPHCNGVLDANATLKTVRQAGYHCAFCQATEEPRLDDTVEVSFTVSPRVRRIAAHEPASLPFWDYYRQTFFGSGVVIPTAETFETLVSQCMLETVEVQPGERMILSLQLPAATIILFDPVTHSSQVLTVEGEPTTERQDLALVFDPLHPMAGRVTLRPGPLRLSLDNRSPHRALFGAFVEGAALCKLMNERRPYLTAKRLLSNQTFRDVYRTDTLDIDQRLKVMSLTFLFTDLKGSTELYEAVGDIVAYDLVRAHFRVLHEIVASESGAVVKTIGDAVMATFPTPDRAVSAALRMQEAMRRLNAERGASDLTLKIGLHEGPCLAVSLNDRQDYFGQTVNIASRVQALASADTIFATDSILKHAAAAALLDAERVGRQPWTAGLRGIGDRVPVYQLALAS